MNVSQIHVIMVEPVLMETICTYVTVTTGSNGHNCESKFSIILYNAKDVIVTSRKNFISTNKVKRIKNPFPMTLTFILRSHQKYGLMFCQLNYTDVSCSKKLALIEWCEVELISLWILILSHPDALNFLGYCITGHNLNLVIWNKCNSLVFCHQIQWNLIPPTIPRFLYKHLK